MPRAYIEMILSSKPGKRRWYLAISCGSNRAWRSRGNLQLDPAGIGDHRLLAITTSPVARLFAGEMMVHLGVEDSFRQGLLQIVEQPARVENRLRVGASQQLVEDSVGYARSLRRGIVGLLSPDHAQPPHEIPDSPTRRCTRLRLTWRPARRSSAVIRRGAVERRQQILLVNPPHQRQLVEIGHRRPAETPERANPSNAHCRRTDRSAQPRSTIATRSARVIARTSAIKNPAPLSAGQSWRRAR